LGSVTCWLVTYYLHITYPKMPSHDASWAGLITKKVLAWSIFTTLIVSELSLAMRPADEEVDLLAEECPYTRKLMDIEKNQDIVSTQDLLLMPYAQAYGWEGTLRDLSQKLHWDAPPGCLWSASSVCQGLTNPQEGWSCEERTSYDRTGSVTFEQAIQQKLVIGKHRLNFPGLALTYVHCDCKKTGTPKGGYDDEVCKPIPELEYNVEPYHEFLKEHVLTIPRTKNGPRSAGNNASRNKSNAKKQLGVALAAAIGSKSASSRCDAQLGACLESCSLSLESDFPWYRPDNVEAYSEVKDGCMVRLNARYQPGAAENIITKLLKRKSTNSLDKAIGSRSYKIIQ